jgi:nitrate/TMAO reductase-like tetraheme cytochrome c subunit
MPDASAPAQPRPFSRNFRNWLSWSGMVLAAGGLFAFLLLLAIDLFAVRRHPYVGILAYVVAPLFFILGIFLTFLGALIRWRTRHRAVRAAEPLAIKIDLSRPRDRRILALFIAASVGFLFLTTLGSYQTYQITESVEFCGKACHLPMEPQFVAFQHTAHASVECVACHVGPGAAAYFKTKLNGVKQLYHTVRNDFDRPIRITAANPRPTQAICEQCHWPKKYVGNVERTYQHYLSDETNTPFAVRLLLNVGGGDPSNGPQGGIHWHMNIANKIEYIATDDQLLSIPWVRMTNPQGVTAEYRDPDFKDDPAKYQIRRMDCMDCHSRPAHKLHTPNEAVDLALSTGRLDPKTPWVKSKVVAALVKPYSTKAEAEEGIANSIREAYPDPAQANTIINEAQAIYRQNFFPEVKVDWRTYPDLVGHKNWNGCFRCHDGKHVTADGKMSIKASDCRSCHLILAQGSGEALNQINAKGHDFVHIDAEYSEFSCSECHTGGVQK